MVALADKTIMNIQAKVFFPWRDEYSVHIPEIDTQHRKLVDLINQLQEAMSDGRGRTVIEKVLEGLEAYTKSHFTSEEQLLARHGYPAISAHRSLHQSFVAKLHKFRMDVHSGSISVTVPVMDFLRDWLTEHIIKEDKAYSAHVLGARCQ